MGRELRLGFAMGGGVSLGAFSGAALTEAMKLAVLRATYVVDDPSDPRHGERVPYGRVVVDVFSGASAGALSLVLMLRSLAQPDPAPDVEDRLRAQFADEFDRLDDARRKQLVAAQHAQDMQHRAWVQEVDIETLLGRKGGRKRDLRHVASILDRGAVDEIAARLLSFDRTPDFVGRQLLGDRVLFAATLSNLTAIQYDARKVREAEEAGVIALRDALTSRGHREVRVFDLRFHEAPKEGRSRWCRYHAADERPGEIGDLRAPSAWAKLGATCIACGAFPFAFEPVVLKRKAYEYGPAIWKRQFAGRVEGDTIWMTYVDGGTFNNEPIREAFRLASFMDARPSATPFDRRIVFVDPRLGPEKISFLLPIHSEYRVREPGWLGSLQGYQLQRLTTLERLGVKAGHILTAILGEATSDEADKIMSVRDRFELRDKARALLGPALEDSPAPDNLRALIKACRDLLQSNREDAEFPPVPYELADELERVIAENPDELGKLAGQAKAFLRDVDGAADKALWLRALVYSYLDLLMDLGGKHEASRVIAIAPIVERKGGKLVYEPLPGHEAMGFAGFTSQVSREFQVEMARYSTELLMRRAGLIERRPGRRTEPPVFRHREQFEREFRAGMEMLAERIRDVVGNSHFSPLIRTGLGFALGPLLEPLSRMEPSGRKVELRIEVPGDRFELDGPGFGDRDRRPIAIDGKYVLIACVEWREAAGPAGQGDGGGAADSVGGTGGRWSGPNVQEKDQTIRVDEQRSILRGGDRLFCRIQLPTAEQVARLDDHPCPQFRIVLRDSDRGTLVPAERWELGEPPVSLEEGLVGVVGD